MSFCEKCGHEYSVAGNFCPVCGKKKNEPNNVYSMSAEQHLKDAVNSLAAGAKEIANIPRVGLKATPIFSIVGILLFFFPWVQFLGFSISGLALAINPKKYDTITILLSIIPITCGIVTYYYYLYQNGMIKVEKIEQTATLGGIIACTVHVFFYFYVTNRFDGFNVFTVWFYLEFLILAGIMGGVYYDKHFSKR